MPPKKPYSFPLTSKDIKRLLRNRSSITLLTVFQIAQKPQLRLVTITKITVTFRSIPSRINYSISYSVSPVDLDLKHHHPVFFSGSGSTDLGSFMYSGYKLYNYQFLI